MAHHGASESTAGTRVRGPGERVAVNAALGLGLRRFLAERFRGTDFPSHQRPRAVRFGMRRIIGVAILLFGLAVAIWPVAGAWRVTAEVRSRTPQNANLVEQNTALFPLLDDDFIFATALYEGTTSDEVTAQLIGAGFTERWFSQAYGSWQGIDCCGEYDAALARATDLDNGQVLVEFSAADRDGQGIWILFALFGLGIAFIGWVIVSLPSKRTLPFEDVSEPELVS